MGDLHLLDMLLDLDLILKVELCMLEDPLELLITPPVDLIVELSFVNLVDINVRALFIDLLLQFQLIDVFDQADLELVEFLQLINQVSSGALLLEHPSDDLLADLLMDPVTLVEPFVGSIL